MPPSVLRRWTAIAAMCENRGIGYRGHLPWKIPEEYNFFLSAIAGSFTLMGRKTWEEIGQKPLPRTAGVILLSTSLHPTPALPHVYPSMDQAVEAFAQEQVAVCGGTNIYQHALPHCSRLLLSFVEGTYPADTYFPAYEHLFEPKTTLIKHPKFTTVEFQRKDC